MFLIAVIVIILMAAGFIFTVWMFNTPNGK